MSIKTIVDADGTVGFNTHDNAQLRSWFQEPVATTVPVSLAELQVYIEIDGPGTIEKIQAAAAGGDATCAKVLRILNPSQFRRDVLDVNDVNVTAILNSLRDNTAVDTFTQADVDAIQAMGQTTHPRWKGEGLGSEPTASDLEIARNEV